MEGSRKRSREEFAVYVGKKVRPLMDGLKCGICWSFLTPPIKCCKNGHNACSRCSETLEANHDTSACGECRHPEGYFIRCRSLDTVVESLVTDCKYECKKRFPLCDMDRHYLECMQRPLNCPYDCTAEVDWNELETHYKNSHIMQDFRQQSSYKFTYALTQGTSDKLLSRNIFMLGVHKDIFFVTQDIHEFGISIYVQSKLEYPNEVTAELEVQGTNSSCKAVFTTIVPNVREKIQGLNRLIIAADTIIGWCDLAEEQTWMVFIQIFVNDQAIL